MFNNIKIYNILLGSKSPRRRELMQMMRIPFNVVTISGVEETYPASMPAVDVPLYLSEKKAEAYLKHIHDNEMIITADTLVILGNEILGKPHSAEDAFKMLRGLSGKTHLVVTGVTIATREKKMAFSCESNVSFAELTDEEIRYYINNFHPMDKAGAYGIQEWIGGIAVEKIDGSFYNVMGLPIQRLYKALCSF